MAYPSFPSNMMCRVLSDSSDTPIIAIMDPDEDIELRYIRAHLYVQGTPTNETAQLKLHTSDNIARVYGESNVVNLIDAKETQNTLTWLKFDFEDLVMRNGTNYYLSFHPGNYTRDNNNFFISVIFDHPNTTNVNGSAASAHHMIDYPKAIQIFGMK